MRTKVRFHIKEYAHDQGLRLGDLARKLRMPLSNLSAIASGRRSVSIQLLSKIARLLNCRVFELFNEEMTNEAVYRDEDLNKEILRVAEKSYQNCEKGWVHRVMLAQQTHYRNARLQKENLHGPRA